MMDKKTTSIINVITFTVILVGCASTVVAPPNYEVSKIYEPKTEVLRTPSIGEMSETTLGDSLVSTHMFKATKGFTLLQDHRIGTSGEKRREMRDHCWLSFIPKGYYIARYENSSYIFYAHTPSASSPNNSLINCDFKGRVQVGFAQSKESPNVYKSWYDRFWNMNNDTVDIDNISIEPHISEDGIFKQEFYYNGKVGSQLKFTYREFTDKGMARNSFDQEVIYDLNDSDIIGFKRAKFQVVDASNTTIKYKVISHFN